MGVKPLGLTQNTPLVLLVVFLEYPNPGTSSRPETPALQDLIFGRG